MLRARWVDGAFPRGGSVFSQCFSGGTALFSANVWPIFPLKLISPKRLVTGSARIHSLDKKIRKCKYPKRLERVWQSSLTSTFRSQQNIHGLRRKLMKPAKWILGFPMVLFVLTSPLSAAEFPDRPVNLMIGYSTGGIGD